MAYARTPTVPTAGHRYPVTIAGLGVGPRAMVFDSGASLPTAVAIDGGGEGPPLVHEDVVPMQPGYPGQGMDPVRFLGPPVMRTTGSQILDVQRWVGDAPPIRAEDVPPTPTPASPTVTSPGGAAVAIGVPVPASSVGLSPTPVPQALLPAIFSSSPSDASAAPAVQAYLPGQAPAQSWFDKSSIFPGVKNIWIVLGLGAAAVYARSRQRKAA